MAHDALRPTGSPRPYAAAPYRGTLHNLGITKALYFGANGFSHLNMNIGEDDLFMQRIMTAENVSIVLSPRASLRERPWGGFRWWFGTERYYGSAIPFYPSRVRSYLRWEPLSRTIFLAAACCALAVLPPELKIAAGVLVAALRGRARRGAALARRLGEQRLLAAYFLYDLLSPVLQLLVSAALLRKDARVWSVDDYIVADDRRLAAPRARGRRHGFHLPVQPLPRRHTAALRAAARGYDRRRRPVAGDLHQGLHQPRTLQPPTTPSGQWVYTIARNTFVDFRRRRQEDLPIDERFAAPASPAPTPEESVINLQQRTQIERYLERLTPPLPAAGRAALFSTACPTRRSPHASTCLSAR